MDCEQARDRLNEALAAPLADDVRSSLAAHLATCSACRAEQESLQRLDAQLRRALRPQCDAAVRVAERVAALVIDAPRPNASPPPTTVVPRRWLTLLVTAALSAAAGFWLALTVGPRPAPPPLPVPASPAPIVARLAAATRAIEVQTNGEAPWRAVSLSSNAAWTNVELPSGSAVRTSNGARCELATVDGCIVRLNDGAEVGLPSPRRLELRQGEIWCSTPPEVTLEVLTGVSASLPPNCTVLCPSTPAAFSCVQGPDCVEVTSARGVVELHTPTTKRTLRPGESVAVVSRQFEERPRQRDPWQAVGWMLPLVGQRPDHPELTERVDSLLAEVGRTKVSYLREQQLRGLGEYGVLPLLRFVESASSRTNPERRDAAMRIVADLAPSWSIGNLVPLLRDEQPSIRFEAARALQRLTGEDHGHSAQDWRQPTEVMQEAWTRWNAWWEENRAQLPARP